MYLVDDYRAEAETALLAAPLSAWERPSDDPAPGLAWGDVVDTAAAAREAAARLVLQELFFGDDPEEDPEEYDLEEYGKE